MATNKATKKDQIGNIIRIRIEEDAYGFGRVVEGGFIEFYDVKLSASQAQELDNRLSDARVLFTLSVHKSWKKNDNWEVVGNNPNLISGIPYQFMQNLANPQDIQLIDPSGNPHPATYEEVQGVERLAVWEDNHVEDRLRDHFAGKPNAWAEHLKPKRT